MRGDYSRPTGGEEPILLPLPTSPWPHYHSSVLWVLSRARLPMISQNLTTSWPRTLRQAISPLEASIS